MILARGKQWLPPRQTTVPHDKRNVNGDVNRVLASDMPLCAFRPGMGTKAAHDATNVQTLEAGHRSLQTHEPTITTTERSKRRAQASTRGSHPEPYSLRQFKTEHVGGLSARWAATQCSKSTPRNTLHFFAGALRNISNIGKQSIPGGILEELPCAGQPNSANLANFGHTCADVGQTLPNLH